MDTVHHPGKMSLAEAGQCVKWHCARLTQLVCVRDEKNVTLRKSITISISRRCRKTVIAIQYDAEAFKSLPASGLAIKRYKV
jgi:hypothetical protein